MSLVYLHLCYPTTFNHLFQTGTDLYTTKRSSYSSGIVRPVTAAAVRLMVMAELRLTSSEFGNYRQKLLTRVGVIMDAVHVYITTWHDKSPHCKNAYLSVL
jgi:hypothetical protein